MYDVYGEACFCKNISAEGGFAAASGSQKETDWLFGQGKVPGAVISQQESTHHHWFPLKGATGLPIANSFCNISLY